MSPHAHLMTPSTAGRGQGAGDSCGGGLSLALPATRPLLPSSPKSLFAADPPAPKAGASLSHCTHSNVSAHDGPNTSHSEELLCMPVPSWHVTRRGPRGFLGGAWPVLLLGDIAGAEETGRGGPERVRPGPEPFRVSTAVGWCVCSWICFYFETVFNFPLKLGRIWN